MADIKERKDFDSDKEYSDYLKKTYGQHIDHRTSWINIAQKPLKELGGKNIIEYLNKRKDIKNPAFFLASMFEENLAKRINEGSIGRYNDDATGSNVTGDANYPYSGFFDFGLDTAGTSVDGFIKKGYLDPSIKERMLTASVGNELGQKVETADFKDFKDIIDFKLAYLKDSEKNIESYIKKNNIKVSPEAQEYFAYVGYNAGLGNAQKMISSFNERGYLKDDAFLKDDFTPEYWKDPYKYSMRRYQGSKMLQNELGVGSPSEPIPLDRSIDPAVQAPNRMNPFDEGFGRTLEQPIDAPQRQLDQQLRGVQPGVTTNQKLNRYQYTPDTAQRPELSSTQVTPKGMVIPDQLPKTNLYNPFITLPETNLYNPEVFIPNQTAPVQSVPNQVAPTQPREQIRKITRKDGDRVINPTQEQFADGGLFGKNDPPINWNQITANSKKRSGVVKDNSKSIKDLLESGVAAGSLATVAYPPVSYGLSLVGSGIDLYDAYNAETESDRNQQLAEAALGLIPYSKLVKGMKQGTDYYKSIKSLMPLNVLNKAVDAKDVIDPNMKISSKNNQQQYAEGGLFGKGFTPGSASGIAGMAGGMLSGIIPTTKKDGTTSIGGSAASGALAGFGAGAALGPIGMIGGALIGGIGGLLGAKGQREEEQLAMQQQQDQLTASTMGNLNSIFNNSSNLPMAFGGAMGNSMEAPVGDFSSFPVGGTHESNPYGGIPQGTNPNGQKRTVEEGEGKFKFRDGDYIFSNRLTFE